MFNVSGAAAPQLLTAAVRRKPGQVCLKGSDRQPQLSRCHRPSHCQWRALWGFTGLLAVRSTALEVVLAVTAATLACVRKC